MLALYIRTKSNLECFRTSNHTRPGLEVRVSKLAVNRMF